MIAADGKFGLPIQILCGEGKVEGGTKLEDMRAILRMPVKLTDGKMAAGNTRIGENFSKKLE